MDQFIRLLPVVAMLLLCMNTHAQDSVSSETTQINEQLMRLERGVDSNRNVLSMQADRNNDISDLSGKIVDWTAFIFGAFTILLLIASVIGFRELTEIRKTNQRIKDLHASMEVELNNVQSLRGSLQQEIRDLEDKVKKDSKDILKTIYLLNQGIDDFKSGALGKAERTFSEVLKINGDDYEATCYLARCFFGQKQYEKGFAMIDKAKKMNPTIGWAYKIEGGMYRRRENLEKSIASLEEAIKIDKRPASLNSLGYSLIKAKNYERGIEVFHESLNLGRRASAAIGLAKGYLLKGMDKEAEKYFNETMTIAEEEILKIPLNVLPRYHLAFSLMFFNKKRACEKQLKRALSMVQNLEAMKYQLFDYKLMLNHDVPQDLLKKCITLIEEELKTREVTQ